MQSFLEVSKPCSVSELILRISLFGMYGLVVGDTAGEHCSTIEDCSEAEDDSNVSAGYGRHVRILNGHYFRPLLIGCSAAVCAAVKTSKIPQQFTRTDISGKILTRFLLGH